MSVNIYNTHTDAQLDRSIRYHEQRMDKLLTRILKNHKELTEERNKAGE